jgi:hypothetical protein
MNNISKSFLSPLLAQAKLRFSGNNSGGSTPQCSNVATNSCNNNVRHAPYISEIPTFCQAKEKEQYSDIDLPLSDAIEEKPSYRKHGCLEFLETRGLAR